jgi:hypothetical protein
MLLGRPAKWSPQTHAPHAEAGKDALGMKMAAELHKPSSQSYDGLPDLDYRFHDCDVTVTGQPTLGPHPHAPQEDQRLDRACSSETLPARNLAGQKLGIKEVDDGIWLVSFISYDLGYVDLEQRTLLKIDNPFGTRLSPMSPGCTN